MPNDPSLLEQMHYHPDPFAVGDIVEVLNDVTTAGTMLPFQQARVRAGARVRILSAIDDPGQLLMLYRFEVLDERDHGTGQWSVCAVDNLRPTNERSLRAWFRDLVR